MYLYDHILKPLLFTMDAERAHQLTLQLFRTGDNVPVIKQWLRRAFDFQEESLRKNLDGLTFKNPVGLAAGFDKDGLHIDLLARLGFGFIEVGTITPRPQIGNPKPRLFRLPKDQSLINRMGFNNAGVEALIPRLQKLPTDRDYILGLNIGKNKDTPNDKALEDYVDAFHALMPYADYFTINVSSPNTAGLRDLQGKQHLTAILQACQDANEYLRPIYLKIAPDLSRPQLDDIITVVHDTRIAGIISNNTSISRDGLQTPSAEISKIGAGGLSGAAIQGMSDELLTYLVSNTEDGTTIIASGGVHSVSAATRKLSIGADLVQVYSGLIYQGPDFIRKINKTIYSSVH